MLIKLVADEIEIKAQNDFYKKWKEEEPEDEFVQNIEYINSLDDIFKPYDKWIKTVTKEESEKYLKITDSLDDFTGVYIADLNCEGFLERLATHKLVDIMETNRPLYFRNYGICDNASQAIEYYKYLIDEGFAREEDNYVIVMTPIFKENQPEYGGWRWHKWGPYVGIQNHEYEYLYDEDEVEMIYVFHIYQMK